MKHFWRSRFIIVAAISLLICLGTIALWLRAAWSIDTWDRTSSRVQDDVVEVRVNRLTFGGGMVSLMHSYRRWKFFGQEDRADYIRVAGGDVTSKTQWYHLSGAATWWFARPAGTSLHNRLGFYWQSYDNEYLMINRDFQITIPDWLVLGVSGLSFVLSFLVVRKRRRLARWRRENRCLACGYDLRASQGRCPECGVVGSV